MSDPQDVEKGNTRGAEEKKRRGQRNLALALMIAGFVIIVYLVTILRLGSSVAERSF